RGYETIASSTSFSWGGQSYPSTKLARAACTSDPNCAGFDSAGYTLPVGSLKLIMDKTYFDCNYLKAGSSKVYLGYKRLPYLSWLTDEWDESFNLTESSEAAKQACDLNPACKAWDTAGRYTIKRYFNRRTFYGSYDGSTMYMKEACPSKFGYTSYYGYKLQSVSGTHGVGTGKMPGGGDDAADFCKLDYRCTAFSSDGSYAIGGVDLISANGSICTYVKPRKSLASSFVIRRI
ncbi:hypothetical protein Vretifemale_20096, partial [Volvox reticuliferus]